VADFTAVAVLGLGLRGTDPLALMGVWMGSRRLGGTGFVGVVEVTLAGIGVVGIADVIRLKTQNPVPLQLACAPVSDIADPRKADVAEQLVSGDVEDSVVPDG
jgi:hypothetical protein